MAWSEAARRAAAETRRRNKASTGVHREVLFHSAGSNKSLASQMVNAKRKDVAAVLKNLRRGRQLTGYRELSGGGKFRRYLKFTRGSGK